MTTRLKCRALKLIEKEFGLKSNVPKNCNRLSIVDRVIINFMYNNRISKLKQANIYSVFVIKWNKEV